MAVRIKLRRGRLSWWTSTNPVLGPSEPGIVKDSSNFKAFIKFGNGTTPWNDLPFFTFETDLTGYVTTAALTTALSNYYTKTEIDAFLDDIADDISAVNTALSGKQDNAIEVTGNTTATNDAFYTVTATATITDPTPAQGKGFTVFVRNGTATVGGTAYATAGTIIRRIFHSGAWASYVYNSGSVSSASIGDITPVNTPIVDNDSVNTFASKTQGQINQISSDSFINAIIFG